MIRANSRRALVSLALGLALAAGGCGRKAEGFFAPERPRLLVFLHGITTPPNLSAENPIVRLAEGGAQNPPGTHAFARERWGFELVSAACGGAALRTLDGQRVDAGNWVSSAPPGAWDPAAPPDSETVRRLILRAEVPRGSPPLFVLLPARDGSQTLLSQTAATIDQVHDICTRAFPPDERPQIIWIAHSAGGLVTRLLLTNPKGPITGGWVSREERLTPAQRERAGFLRDRTLFAVTIATPHEGSVLADETNGLMRFIETGPAWLRTAMAIAGLATQDALRAGITFRDCMADLRTAHCAALNAGPLRPGRARRTAAAFGGAAAVPIYALGGRSPAATLLCDPNPKAVIESLRSPVPTPTGRDALASTLGLVMTDAFVASFADSPRRGWGRAADPRLDTVERISLATLIGDGAASGELRAALDAASIASRLLGAEGFDVPTADALFGALPVEDLTFPLYLHQGWRLHLALPDIGFEPTGEPVHDGEIDSDGMVGLDSALGAGLGDDHTQGGAWYRCFSGPWDLNNHVTLTADPALGRWLHDALIARAGPFANPEAEISVWPVSASK